MKTHIRHSIIAVGLALALLTTGWAQSKPQTIQVSVQGMVCNFCAVGIEKSLRKVNGVDGIYINLDKRLVAVTTKPGATVTTDQIAKTVKDSGFKVVKIETTDKALDQIKKETNK